MFKTDLRPGEAVDVDNGRIIVRVEAKSGQVARLSFEAADEVQIRKMPNSTAQFARKGLGKPG